jgi:hypothetical protein
VPPARAFLLCVTFLCVSLGCGAPADSPVDAPPPAPVAATSTSGHAPEDSRDADLVARWPSLAHYPTIPPDLAHGLRARDAAAVFRGLEQAFAAVRWQAIEHWERLAHIRIAAPSGFCRTEAGAPQQLSPGTFDLGCFGGFLEAVRLLYLPRVELAELIACDPPGGFESCADGAHAGRAALLQIGARLPPEALPRGLELLDQRIVPDDPDALLPALAATSLHLCSVSHRARARDGERMYHHMMIVDPTRDRLGRVRVFDTTGANGVAYRPMRPARLHKYVHRLLALNDVYRYDPASAILTCLAVRRPDALPPVR